MSGTGQNGLKVPANAFEVNTIGPAGIPFPFSVHTDVTAGGIWTLSLVALDVSDIAGAWRQIAQPYTYIWNVGHYLFRPGSRTLLLDLEEIARSRAIDVTGYDIRWARLGSEPAGEASHGLIRVRSSDLPRLVEDFYAYDFEMIDSSKELSNRELEAFVLVANTRDRKLVWVDRPAWSSHYVSNHDACYMSQEAHSSDLLRATVSRALVNFAVASAGTNLEVTPPTADVLDQLVAPHTAWTAPRDLASVSEEEIGVALCRGGWRLDQPLPREPAIILRYSRRARLWEWRPL